MLKFYKYSPFLTFIFIFNFLFLLNSKIIKSEDNFQILKEFVWGEEFKFRIVPENTPLIPDFPINILKSDSDIKSIEFIVDNRGNYYSVNINTGTGEDSKVRVYFSIHSSINNAQIEIMETLSFSSLNELNAIDHIVYHEIGDNCWYNIHNFDDNMNEIMDSEVSGIHFLRNNIRIYIENERYYDNSSALLALAEKIDGVLIKSEKVESPSLIKFPVVTSFEITGGSSVVGSSVITKTEAYDPQGEKLILRGYGWPENLSREDGVYEFGTNNPGIMTMIVWVINEDRLISIARKEVTF